LAGLEGRGDLAAALPLAKEFNLLCSGAAFVAWDDSENVAVASEQIYQPSQVRGLLASGVQKRQSSPRQNRRGFTEMRAAAEDHFGVFRLRFDNERLPSLPPRSEWSNEPMFQVPWGPEVLSLLERWLGSYVDESQERAERRLRNLIAEVLLTTKADPAEQLKDLAGRLDWLFGNLGPFQIALQALRQSAGW
jgi:hypothetical protein